MVFGGVLYSKHLVSLIQLMLIEVGAIAIIVFCVFQFKNLKKKNFKKLLKRAEDLYNGRDPETALKTFQKALNIDSESYEVHLGMAQCYRMTMKYEEAVKEYQQAINIKPDTHHAYFLKGIVEMQMNRPYDSLRSFRQAEEMKPDFEDLHYFLGQLFEKTMQIKEAIRYYEKYVKNCSECKMKGAIEQKLARLKEKMKVYEPKLIDGDQNDASLEGTEAS